MAFSRFGIGRERGYYLLMRTSAWREILNMEVREIEDVNVFVDSGERCEEEGEKLTK